MRQWSELLLEEMRGWPQVKTRPMFGMTGLYRGSVIFGVLPRTRALDEPYAVSFKMPRGVAPLERALAAEKRITASPTARWISFELESGKDIADALEWFARAYEQAGGARAKR
jgi:hypothetical protein